MQPVFSQEKANELIREFNRLTQQVGKLEKRLDKLGNVLRAVFELVGTELHLEPAALAEKLASVVREKAERVQAPCSTCKRPLGNKTKCMYCARSGRPNRSSTCCNAANLGMIGKVGVNESRTFSTGIEARKPVVVAVAWSEDQTTTDNEIATATSARFSCCQAARFLIGTAHGEIVKQACARAGTIAHDHG